MFSGVTGPNYFAAKEYLDKKIASFVGEHGDMAVERIDGENSDSDHIINSVQSTTFLAPKKLIVISNLSAQKGIATDLEEFIKLIFDTNEVIVFEPKPDKRSSYYKKLKSSKNFNEFTELNEHQLRTWIIEQSKNMGATISQTNASYLIGRVGLNQSKLNNELYKLIKFSKDITKDNIDELTDPTPQSSIFNLLDVAFSGNHKKTMELYDDQRAQGTEPLNILGMIVWQMHAVAIADSAKDKSASEISSASGLSPFVVQKSQAISNKLGTRKIKHILTKLIELDTAFKTVIIDQDTAMKNFLTVMSYR